MSAKSAIEWTDATWNPTTGCDRVSPGCDHCYALTMAGRLKLMGSAGYQNDGSPLTSGPGFGLTLHEDRLVQPLRWKRPRRIFVNSMSDLFHPEVPTSFIRDVWSVMAQCPQHTFQVLTKRPQRLPKVFRDLDGKTDPIPALPNVWLGTSIENATYAFRANHLRETPAARRFLSIEPLVGPLPPDSLNLIGINWVIVGGESGPGARPMHPRWVRDIRDHCQDRGVAFFFKQWGEFTPESVTLERPLIEDRALIGGQVEQVEAVQMVRVGKHKAGRELDGRTWDEMPV